MTFGLQLFNASGQVSFDSRYAQGGVIADQVTRAAGSGTEVRTYPAFAGRTAIVKAGGYDAPGAVDYALGYPRVTFTPGPYLSTTWIVIVY